MRSQTVRTIIASVALGALCLSGAAFAEGPSQPVNSCQEVHKALLQFKYDGVEALARECRDIEARDEHGLTLLMQVSNMKSKLMAHNDVQDLLARELLDKGANVHARDHDGRTALMHTEVPRIGKMLLEKGSDVHAVDNEGSTALILLSKRHKSKLMASVGDLFMMDLLLQNGANVNAQDKEGKTALMWAAAYCNLPAVERLLEAGAEVNIRDKEGNTALSLVRLAPEKDRKPYQGDELEALLIEHGATESGASAPK